MKIRTPMTFVMVGWVLWSLLFQVRGQVPDHAHSPASIPVPNESKGDHIHGEGVPFFRVDGQNAPTYFPAQSVASGFALPNYISPKHFVVGQTVHLEIDPGIIDTPFIRSHNATIPDAQFEWHFGDNLNGRGTKSSHTYQKPGSYVVSIFIISKSLSSPVLFRSLLLHILPSADYTLPLAVVAVNGKVLTDNDKSLNLTFKEPVTLSGIHSKPGSSDVVEYRWDLSDRNFSSASAVTHQYNSASYNAKPILRIKDAQGLMSYATFEIINKETSGNHLAQPAPNRSSYVFLFLTAGAVLVILSAAGFVMWRRTRAHYWKS